MASEGVWNDTTFGLVTTPSGPPWALVEIDSADSVPDCVAEYGSMLREGVGHPRGP